jgi:hypothetical protein
MEIVIGGDGAGDVESRRQGFDPVHDEPGWGRI